jgi:hypothetical protein
MVFHPFGLGGLRASGAGPDNQWALASLTVVVLSWLACAIAWSGMFQRSCGQWGLDCVASAVIVLAIGATVGLLMACASFSAGTQRWLSWTVLLLNGVPAVACGALILMVLS